MMRKLRTLLVAALLVPALFSTASAFTTESDGGFDPARPPAGWCVLVLGAGMVIVYEC